MGGRTRTWATVGSVMVVLTATLGAAVSAHAATPTKPSLKISGLSVNRQFARPGHTYKANDGTNECYTIGGPAGQPPSLTVYGFVNAVKIPKSAPTTVVYTTPWSARFGANLWTYTGAFSTVLFRVKTHSGALLFGGPAGPFDFYSYSQMPSGAPTSTFLDGKYKLSVTTTVAGKALHAVGSVTVAC